ncbi:hypothetical protein LSUB1_G001829 [Lachnellula subtilissima]|uniref:Uncharacterized protein n=1 Tax=Lachnellula subtilissima TaxID=602034 RepID=A0A8H8S137_9HELO|nr:hypothetical protein LSUB1_G001829 [Lachnellula subtilissima]
MAKYDRDTAVTAVASFYECFATLPASSPVVIEYPPVGGWPDITPENLAPLNKKLQCTITNWKQQEHPGRAKPSQDFPYAWRAYCTLPIIEFFEEWKERFRNIERMRGVKAIYVEHGWRTDQWRPDDFKVAALAWMQKKRDE